MNPANSNTTLPGLSFSLDLGVIELEEGKALEPETLYDLLIIGAGPAGINAAIYAIRKGLTVGIITRNIGGQIKDTAIVENYLGIDNVTGTDLISRFHNHLKAYDIPILRERNVVSINRDEELFVLELDDGSLFRSRTVLIATGAKPRQLGVPGEKEFVHKGVTYCAICDGPLYQGQDVVVVGGGNTAVESAIDLARYVRKVTLVHRSVFRAEKVLMRRIEDIKNVEIKLGYVVEEIKGDNNVNSVVLRNLETDDKEELATVGVLIEIGNIPVSESFKDLLETNAWNEIVVDEDQATSVPGIFAAGDVTSVKRKQIIIAAAAGANAALAINEYLNKQSL